MPVTALWARKAVLCCGGDGGPGVPERFCIMFCFSSIFPYQSFQDFFGIAMRDLSKSKFIKCMEVLVILLVV